MVSGRDSVAFRLGAISGESELAVWPPHSDTEIDIAPSEQQLLGGLLRLRPFDHIQIARGFKKTLQG